MTIQHDNSNVVSIAREEVHTGQLRFAQRFARTYTDRLMNVHGLGWYVWADTHWQADHDGAPIRAVADLLRDAWTEMGALDSDARKRLARDIGRCESASGVNGVLTLAGSLPGITASVDSIDADPELFNCRNGTLELSTGRLRAHDPTDRITRCAGADLDPDATSTRWDAFLTDVLPDEAVREFLQRVFGMAMLGRVEEHILAILSGTGANGKTVCYETVLAAFGDYGIVVDPKVVMASKNALHGTHYMDLMGRRLVVTSETSEGGRLDAAIVKRLTGGDRIRANRMHRDTIEFRPSHTIALVTNHKPGADANDEALWRRLRVVGFDVVVPEARRDTQLGDRLRADDLTAVLAWCWRGWLDYRDTGLAAPEAVTRRTDEYRAEGDSIGEFVAEQCVTHEYARVGASELFRAWQAWSLANNVPAMNQHQFGRALDARGYARKPLKGRKVYIGLGIAADDEKAGQHAFDE